MSKNDRKTPRRIREIVLELIEILNNNDYILLHLNEKQSAENDRLSAFLL